MQHLMRGPETKVHRCLFGHAARQGRTGYQRGV